MIRLLIRLLIRFTAGLLAGCIFVLIFSASANADIKLGSSDGVLPDVDEAGLGIAPLDNYRIPTECGDSEGVSGTFTCEFYKLLTDWFIYIITFLAKLMIVLLRLSSGDFLTNAIRPLVYDVSETANTAIRADSPFLFGIPLSAILIGGSLFFVACGGFFKSSSPIGRNLAVTLASILGALYMFFAVIPFFIGEDPRTAGEASGAASGAALGAAFGHTYKEPTFNEVGLLGAANLLGGNLAELIDPNQEGPKDPRLILQWYVAWQLAEKPLTNLMWGVDPDKLEKAAERAEEAGNKPKAEEYTATAEAIREVYAEGLATKGKKCNGGLDGFDTCEWAEAGRDIWGKLDESGILIGDDKGVGDSKGKYVNKDESPGGEARDRVAAVAGDEVGRRSNKTNLTTMTSAGTIAFMNFLMFLAVVGYALVGGTLAILTAMSALLLPILLLAAGSETVRQIIKFIMMILMSLTISQASFSSLIALSIMIADFFEELMVFTNPGTDGEYLQGSTFEQFFIRFAVFFVCILVIRSLMKHKDSALGVGNSSLSASSLTERPVDIAGKAVGAVAGSVGSRISGVFSGGGSGAGGSSEGAGRPGRSRHGGVSAGVSADVSGGTPGGSAGRPVAKAPGMAATATAASSGRGTSSSNGRGTSSSNGRGTSSSNGKGGRPPDTVGPYALAAVGGVPKARTGERDNPLRSGGAEDGTPVLTSRIATRNSARTATRNDARSHHLRHIPDGNNSLDEVIVTQRANVRAKRERDVENIERHDNRKSF